MKKKNGDRKKKNHDVVSVRSEYVFAQQSVNLKFSSLPPRPMFNWRKNWILRITLIWQSTQVNGSNIIKCKKCCWRIFYSEMENASIDCFALVSRSAQLECHFVLRVRPKEDGTTISLIVKFCVLASCLWSRLLLCLVRVRTICYGNFDFHSKNHNCEDYDE